MNGRLIFYSLLTVLILAMILEVGYKIGNHQLLVADIISSTNSQNSTSSLSNSTSSLDNSANPSSTATLADLLQNLQNQVQLLTNQMIEVRSSLELLTLRAIFTRTLQKGDAGDDVGKLQKLLSKLGAYPTSTITGFYGQITKEAVLKFQENEGLKQTGVFDQETRDNLFESQIELITEGSSSTEFSPLDLSTIPQLQTLGYSQNSNASSSSTSSSVLTLGDLENQISQLSSDSSSTQSNLANLQNQVSQMSADISNIQTALGSLANQSSPVTTPSPTPAPAPSPLTISNVQATNITKTASTITWITNNPSNSAVYYSLNSTMPYTQTLAVSSSAIITSHNLNLSQLTSSSSYYYVVVSRDSYNNTASSTKLSFITQH